MRRSCSPLARFDERSLALFAALMLSGFGATAQTRPAGPATEDAVVMQVQAEAVSKPAPLRHGSADQAFGRADANGDGKLSRDETQRLPAVWQRFDDIDVNHDRFISRDEFHRGIAN